MTPKEKAKELIDKYLNASFNCNDCTIPFCDIACTKLYTKEAAECALILVDEIIDCTHSEDIIEENCCPVNGYDKNAKYTYEYWEKVKNELLKQQNNG